MTNSRVSISIGIAKQLGIWESILKEEGWLRRFDDNTLIAVDLLHVEHFIENGEAYLKEDTSGNKELLSDVRLASSRLLNEPKKWVATLGAYQHLTHCIQQMLKEGIEEKDIYAKIEDEGLWSPDSIEGAINDAQESLGKSKMSEKVVPRLTDKDLHNIKRIYETQREAGNKIISLNNLDFSALLETAEQYLQIQLESHELKKENQQLRESITKAIQTLEENK